MTEPVRDPMRPATAHDPVDPDAEVAHKNVVLGLALFGLFLLLFAGVFVVAFIYLALD
ncbi:MAG: hypothetical protein H0V79_04890 [Actinobacteria bacterium]|nr:hypothetical protein [Actinomycetota bacterium]